MRFVNRRFFQSYMIWVLLAMLLATGCSVQSAPAARTPDRPNILVYVVDDQGTTDAGCYGNPVIKTPGLDMLAEEGVRFRHAFCTSASCSASRSVILTGMFNHANGQYGHEHSYHHFRTFDNVQSLPVLLSKAGYRTARSGKYHVGPESVYYFEKVIGQGNEPVAGAKGCRDFIAAKDDEPFFLYFCTNQPHRPFERKGFKEADPKKVVVPPYLPATSECRDELAKYYASVEKADAGLLELIGILKETGKWDNTVVIYCSDNGIAFPGAKTTLYEPGMRLPFVMRDPAGAAGKVTDAMISYVDLTPTLLDYAGVKVEGDQMQGRSFKKVLSDPKAEGFDEVYASHTFHEITMYYPMRVVRTRQYKLIWNIAYGLEYPFASDLYASPTWQGLLKSGRTKYAGREIQDYLHRPKFELFDLKNDPRELKNLADDPKYASVLKELQGKMKAFQEKTNDPWVLKWEYE